MTSSCLPWKLSTVSIRTCTKSCSIGFMARSADAAGGRALLTMKGTASCMTWLLATAPGTSSRRTMAASAGMHGAHE